MGQDLTQLQTDELLEEFAARTEDLKQLKEDIGAIEEVIVARMEDDGVNWLVLDESQFTINHPRDAVEDKDFLVDYLGEDWALVVPMSNPRKKALRELAQIRGDDPETIFQKVFKTKYSRKLKMSELPLDWEEEESTE